MIKINGKSKICDFNLNVHYFRRIDQDVLRLQVPVNNPSNLHEVNGEEELSTYSHYLGII